TLAGRASIGGWQRGGRQIGVEQNYRLSLAVNDIAPAPQQGQLMATRIFCFCSSSRSVRSSNCRACCSNNACSESALCEIWSSGVPSEAGWACSFAGARRTLRLRGLRDNVDVLRSTPIASLHRAAPLFRLLARRMIRYEDTDL